MRKKEVRWISRDLPASRVEIWNVQPKKTKNGFYINPESEGIGCADSIKGRISRICGLEPWAAITIAAGGLVKVTIERQY